MGTQFAQDSGSRWADPSVTAGHFSIEVDKYTPMSRARVVTTIEFLLLD